MAQNSTWLFIKQGREYRNAEVWWTSLFSMLILLNSSAGRASSFPWYLSSPSGNLIPSGTVSFEGVGFKDLVVDGKLRGPVFKLKEWPNSLLDLRPDIAVFDTTNANRVTFVEVKTVGCSVSGNLLTYSDLVAHLAENGWDAQVYYLLSEGHEAESDWSKLNNLASRILKWEDVMRSITQSELSRVFDFELLAFAGDG